MPITIKASTQGAKRIRTRVTAITTTAFVKVEGSTDFGWQSTGRPPCG